MGPDDRRVTWLRRCTTVVLVAGLVACASEGGSAPADPSLLEPGDTQGPVTSSTVPDGGATTSTAAGSTSTTADLDGEDDTVAAPDPNAVPTSALPSASSTRTLLPGFGEVVVQVRRVDGEVVEWCLLLAETDGQTQRGA